MNFSSITTLPKCLAKVGWLGFLVGFFFSSGSTLSYPFSGEQLSNLVVSRKRKAWEGLHAGGSKGGPGRREEEEQEDGEEEKEEEEGGGSGEEGSRAWEEEEQEQNQAHFTHPRPSHHHLLSPLNTNFVHEEVDQTTITYGMEVVPLFGIDGLDPNGKLLEHPVVILNSKTR